MVPPDPTGPASDQRPSTSFLSVFPKVALPMFLALADQSIVATALPAIAGSLGAVEQISLVVIGYLIAATVAAPVYGRLGDVFGRRRMLLGALGIFMSASVVCSLSGSLAVLVVGRIVQGLGGGGLMALSQALIGESVEPRDRARYQGYLATVGVTANAFGPVAGGILTEWLGWRSIFLVNLPLGVLAFWLISRLPRRPRRDDDFRFDYAGLFWFACFVVSVLVLLDHVQRFDASELPLMGLLAAAAVVSLALLMRTELRSRLPLLPLDLFRDGSIWRATAMAACHGGILVSLLTFVPIYMRVVHSTSASLTGFLIVPMTVGIGIGSIITGTLVSRTGRTAIMPSFGLAIVALGLAAIAFYSPRLSQLELSASLGTMALFLGTVMSVVQVTVQAAAGQTRLGAAAAAVQYTRSMGAALGTALVAAVLFATLSRSDPDAGRLFGEVLRNGPDVLSPLTPARSAEVQKLFAEAFRAAFLVVSGMACVATLLVWTLPLRRI